MIPREKILPTVLMIIDVCAAIGYVPKFDITHTAPQGAERIDQ
jgi:hypothetical protein